jgi:hypothetical protein
MQRVFGALAIFGGWLCILLSAFFGLIASQFLGLNAVEGDLPPSGIYGVPAVTLMWVALGTAVLTAVPAAAAMIAADPSRRLYIAAGVMGVVGLALLPEELGRAYAVALIPGAVLLSAGGWLTHQAGAIGAEPGAQLQAGSGPTKRAESAAESADAAETTETGGAAARLGTDTTGAAVETAGAASGMAADPSSPAQAEASSSGTETSAPMPGKRANRRPAKTVAKSQTETIECPWCSASITAPVERCPSCGAALISPPESLAAAIPGVTAVKPELRDYAASVAARKKRPSLLSLVLSDPENRLFAGPVEPIDSGALRPPSAEVKAEMDRLDREIAVAGRVGETDSFAAEPGVGAAEPGVGAAEPSAAAKPGVSAADGSPPSDPRPTSNS